MPVTIQVTLGAAATQVSSLNINVQGIQFQNNSAHNIRYGDSSVSVTTPAAVNGGTAGKGTLLASGSPGGSGSPMQQFPRGTILSQWYIAGTQNDVIDITYEP